MGRKWQIILSFSVLALALIGYWLFNWLLDPKRAFRQFLDAIERKDIDRIYAMVLNEEKEAGLTKEQVAKALDFLLYRHGQIQGEVILADWETDRWFIADVHWWKVEGQKLLPLPKTRRTGPTVVVRLHFFRPPRRLRWQVNFSRFVWFQLYFNLAPVRVWVRQNPQLKKDLWKLEKMRRDWAREVMRKEWGIKEVFPLPVMTKTRGRYVIIWGRWEEEGF